MTKKRDESLSKSEALVVSWKARADYKGYDKSKGSSYWSWRGITNTVKGKDIGFPDEWKNYSAFLLDVRGEWKAGKIVCRVDTKNPHSKTNSYWTEKGAENLARLVSLEYDGLTKTLIEWCAELKLNYQGVRQRYFKGNNYTPKEVLFGKEKKSRSKRDRDTSHRINAMLGAYRLRDKNKGLFNDLTLDFFKSEIEKGCVYCEDKESVGLDRVDNSQGHHKGNVVPCCYVCNCARNNNFSFDEMKVIGLSIKEVKRTRDENKQI